MRILAMLTAIGLAASCGDAPDDDLTELIARHTQARGGASAIEAISAVRMEVEIEEPGFTVTGDYRATADMMRIDIFDKGKRVFSEGVDENGAWQQMGKDAPFELSSEKGRAALLHGIEFNLFGLHQLAARGHSLVLLGDETIDGIAYKVVGVTLADGFETFLYINPESALIERRRDVRALHPDADPSEKLLETIYFDFARRCGVLSPASTRQIDARTGEELQRTRVARQVCNVSGDALRIERDALVDQP